MLLDLSRTKVQRLIVRGSVTVDGRTGLKASFPVEPGQELVVQLPREEPTPAPQPRAVDFEIIHEDEHMVIINKPAGLVVHAGAGDHDVTLVNGLLHLYGESLSSVAGTERPGIVHRLDMGTSGVMAVARTDAAHEALSDQFAARTVDKEYSALVYGCPRETSGEVDLAVGRDRSDRTKISADTDRPRDARTAWDFAEDFGGLALLNVRPHTGRTHQVRVHLAAIHHPCVGDPKYAGAQWRGIPDGARRALIREFGRPALHSRRLRLDHPVSGERLEFEATLPNDFAALLEALRRGRDKAG